MRAGARLSLGAFDMAAQNSASDYAGDVDVREAWTLLGADPKAQLIDCRTAAEWAFVGLPDLSSLGRNALCVEWQSFPSMTVDPEFTNRAANELRRAGADSDTPVLFLCRSGARSRAAAIAMTRAGFAHAYNIAGGFEGDMDQTGHRGQRNGWKAADLPWRQS
jgi:rhodanese-related sulfurtransferase